MVTTVTEARPTWYRVASWLAVLWMLTGVMAFVMDLMTDEAALAQMSAAQRELYEARPAWLLAMYAIAVGTGLVGAIGLVLRKTWAVALLWISLIAVVIQFAYTIFGMQAIERLGAAQVLPLPVFIFVAGVLVLWLAVTARGRGWLVR
jgi:hypothetical protein